MSNQSQPPAAGEAAHTPTPWHTMADGDALHIAAQIPSRPDSADSAPYTVIAECLGDGDMKQATVLANAAFIVRAVNSYDALVEALEDMMKLALAHGLKPMTESPRWEDARAALAKAKAHA